MRVGLWASVIAAGWTWLSAINASQLAHQFVERGDTAFERGDYADAVAAYSQAEGRHPDPGLVAFNQAAALYRLGRYRECALAYRCSLEDASGTRRARALFNRGNALVQDAREAELGELEEAIQAYEECLRQPAVEPGLHEDARYNLELARVLLANARSQDRAHGASGGDVPNHRARGNGPQPEEMEGHSAVDGQDPDQGPNLRDNVVKQPGQAPGASRKLFPGIGNLPPIPDQEGLVPMTREDACSYLEDVVARVARERRGFRQASGGNQLRRMKDW
jgi:tetratricopeptide (TPR) repeat protein